MARLNQTDIGNQIKGLCSQDRPILGICLGMQLFFSESSEFGSHQGLNLIKGKVDRLTFPQGSIEQRVPLIGWHRLQKVEVQKEPRFPDIFDCIQPEEYFYFVHSYHCLPVKQDVKRNVLKIGETEIVASVQAGSLYCCQFHPEKSGEAGLNLVNEFLKI